MLETHRPEPAGCTIFGRNHCALKQLEGRELAGLRGLQHRRRLALIDTRDNLPTLLRPRISPNRAPSQ
jgi:hypothetical protein